jgi:MYXO-CTERM domain-containing protein
MKNMSYFLRAILMLSSMIVAAPHAYAAPIVLTFEGVGDYASVNEFYNGGTDSDNNSGVNYGVSFSSISRGTIDSDAGGSGNIANEPSGDTVLFFQSGAAATMNVATGFDTGFSFFYSSGASGFVNVYSGLNASGSLLATINLASNMRGCVGDPNGDFCRFTAIGVTFDGIARSVDFGGTANQIAFDNITIGSEVADPTDTPEPATLALAVIGLAGLLAARRRLPGTRL